jgi:hypothetical protein
MKQISSLFALVVMFLHMSSSAFSGMSKTFRTEGVVDGINKDTVTLWVRGKLLKVDRKSIPEFYKVRPGERVEAYVSGDGLVAETKKN